MLKNFKHFSLKVLKSFLNRKSWLLTTIVFFLTGMVFIIAGTFVPDETTPRKIEFFTNSRYTLEMNDFFNRSITNPNEDAQNKLLEDYWVRGYAILPKQPVPSSGYPAVIWMHGFGVNAESQLNFPRHLAKNGFFVLAINHPGHGDSSGLWDMCIQELVGIYSAVDWLIDTSEFKTIIDPDRVGVAGHSLGGIDTTRAGIFDSWMNERTGNMVGTGGRIRASCAVYCWDNLTSMAEILVQAQLGVPDIWNDPVVTNMLQQWRWFSNHDPSTIFEETQLRSVSNFINATNIKNYCLITGSRDQFTSVQAQCHILANATIGGTGAPQVPWNEVYDAVQAAPHHTWDFGDVANGTARKLVILQGQDHLEEAFSSQAVNNMTAWFSQAMATNITLVLAEPVIWCIPHFFVMGGCFVIATGVIIGTMPLFSHLCLSRLNPRGSCRAPATARTIPREVKDDGKSRWIQGCVVAGVSGIAGFIQLPSITHYWIFDLVIPRFLSIALFMIPCVLVLVTWKAKLRNARPRWDWIGFHGSFLENGKAALLPWVSIMPWVLIACVIAWSLHVPFLMPRPLEFSVMIDFFTLLGIMFSFNLLNEMIFRGTADVPSMNDKMEANGRRANWIAALRSAMFSGVFIGSGFALNIIIGFGGVFVYRISLIPLICAASIGINFMFGILGAYMKRLTGNIIPASLFLAILATIIMGGKLVWPYA